MDDLTHINIRKGVSLSPDAEVAAKELFDAIYQPDITFATFYCSADYDLDILGAELKRHFCEVNLIGCTTAGEITPNGYLKGSLTGVSLAPDEFEAVTTCIDDLDEFGFAKAGELTHEMFSRFRQKEKIPSTDNTFGFMLIDGLSLREEDIASALHGALGGIQMFGGSAGDGTDFRKTFVYYDAGFREGRAVFSLIHTSLPFMVFKSEHVVATDEMMVVTSVDVKHRIVYEINAEPAAEEYARLLAMNVEQLNSAVFALHPLLIRIGGENFVRSIQKVNADLSLTFYCAIDKGIVMRLAKGGALVETVKSMFKRVRKKIGDPLLVIGCDCILRRIEIEQTGIANDVDNLSIANNMVGFNTYGEQFNGMHVNQTFTGVAIGHKSMESVG